MAEQTAAVQPSKPASPKTMNQNPSTPFSSFMYKAIMVSVIIALLPIFPPPQSQDPPSKSILSRGWELLHLLLVGVAISYGLFSRRNSDPEVDKETQQKPDTPQSYVSQILQVSPVFDDEETKIQTWNYSQYHREEPVLMVEEASRTKPLFLPVRSLKSRPQYPDLFDPGYEINGTDAAGETGKASVVLPSPIPWRSRSGRMEVKDESPPSPSPRPHHPLASSFDADPSLSRTPSFQSRTPSPRRSLSPSPSLAREITGKTNEDVGRRRSFHKSSPPPPPPPPPPPSHAPRYVSERRNARKSFKDELKDLSHGVGSRSLKPEASSVGRSVRRVRSNEGRNLPPLPRNQSEKRNSFRARMIIASDSESDDDRNDGGSSESDEEEKPNVVSAEEPAPEENEVDKKADEFIAKFREQIRLQRIESIKRSAAQRSTKNSS